MEEEEEKHETNPTKCISISQKITIACQIMLIAFEGRSDSRSIKNVLSQVSPRKLILVHGDKEDKIHLTKHVQTTMDNVCKAVFYPEVRQTPTFINTSQKSVANVIDTLCSNFSVFPTFRQLQHL